MIYQGFLNGCSISSQYQLLPNTFSIFNQLNLNSQPISQFFLNKISMWRHWSDIDVDQTLREPWFTFLARASFAGYWEDIDQTLTWTKHWEYSNLLFWHVLKLAGYWEDIDQALILTKLWENPDLLLSLDELKWILTNNLDKFEQVEQVWTRLNKFEPD